MADRFRSTRAAASPIFWPSRASSCCQAACEPIAMMIAQISDTHIVAPGKLFRCPVQGAAADSERVYREFDTAAYLAAAVAALNALVPRPDVAVVTGDLVDHGEPEE